MKKKERALVTVSAGYAFGIHAAEKEGWTASVPPNATVTYDVTLMDFVKAKETWDMSVEEKLEAATVSKDKGNVAFKAGKLDRAQKLWERAKQAIEYDDSFEPDQKKTAREIKRSCELNLAALHLKEGRFVEARKAADKVLDADSFHLKALYRRAQAYMGTGDWVEAAQDIKKALGVDAQNNDFRLLAKRLKAAEAEATKGEAALWAESFAKMAATRKALEVKATGAVVNGGGVEAAIEADAGTADGAVAPMAAES
jgi:tetratricopeptide (TPR) repeat protein